jgi:hypothetical protein
VSQEITTAVNPCLLVKNENQEDVKLEEEDTGRDDAVLLRILLVTWHLIKLQD